MKPNELQIGDWAACEGKNGKVKELREHKLSLKTENSVMIVYYNNVKPIPITPEILEKNGFGKTLDEDDIECYRFYNRAGDGYIKITLYDGGDGDWSLEIVNYDKFNDKEIRYKNESSFLKVHQLQHALRLAGICKMIEL